MDFSEMTIEQLNERRSAIASEIDAPDADLDALEAEALTGLPVHDRPTAEATARKLVEMGAAGACITLGERGVCCANRTDAHFLAGMPVQMTNATGAGDAFCSGVLYGESFGSLKCGSGS